MFEVIKFNVNFSKNILFYFWETVMCYSFPIVSKKNCYFKFCCYGKNILSKNFFKFDS